MCRPGGTIGMINFTPEGLAAEFFELFGRYAPPPPPGALPPVLWGSEEHVRELFGDRLASLELTRRHYVERSPGGPAAYCDFFKQTFGPVVGLDASLADRPDRLAALDRDFLGSPRAPIRGRPAARPSTTTSTCSSSGDGRGDGFRVRPAKSRRGGAARRRRRGG